MVAGPQTTQRDGDRQRHRQTLRYETDLSCRETAKFKKKEKEKRETTKQNEKGQKKLVEREKKGGKRKHWLNGKEVKAFQ